MKVLIHWWEMGAFPVTVPFKEGEDDPRRAIEVPDDLHERFVEAHEQFCAVLSEIDVQCVEILDAPYPDAPHLRFGRVYPGGRYSGAAGFDGWEAACERCGATSAVEARRPSSEGHARALREILGRGWRERRHGGLACPECAPAEKLLEADTGADPCMKGTPRAGSAGGG